MPKVKVHSYPEVPVVGLSIHTKAMSGEIPPLWEKLGERQGEIENLDDSGHVGYGISIMEPDFEETNVFDYIAGLPVTGEPEEVPEGMAAFTIPAGEYAVVLCPNLASIQQGYEAIYNRWLPDSEYALDISKGNFCFELYGEEFNPAAGSGKFYIYVPVKKK